MKFHPGQLEIDFSIPAKDLLTVNEVWQSLYTSRRWTRSDVLTEIYEGRLAAIDVSRDGADREDYIIPLKNFVAFLNEQYTDKIYFRFPTSNLLKPLRVAELLNKSDEHIYHFIADGEFPNVINLKRTGSRKADWEIPLRDFVAFVNRRREGCFA